LRAFLISLIVFLSGCGEKPDSQKTISKVTFAEETQCHIDDSSDTPSLPLKPKKHIKALIALKSQNGVVTQTIHIEDENITFQNKIPFILVTLFDIQCKASRTQLPYLQRLQEKFPQTLQVIAIQANTDAFKESLSPLQERYKLSYINSNDSNNTPILDYFTFQSIFKTKLPLMVLYHDGEYVQHYIGATPIEMINYDIVQFLEKKD